MNSNVTFTHLQWSGMSGCRPCSRRWLSIEPIFGSLVLLCWEFEEAPSSLTMLAAWSYEASRISFTWPWRGTKYSSIRIWRYEGLYQVTHTHPCPLPCPAPLYLVSPGSCPGPKPRTLPANLSCMGTAFSLLPSCLPVSYLHPVPEQHPPVLSTRSYASPPSSRCSSPASHSCVLPPSCALSTP